MKTPDFQGWACSQCAWRFDPSDAIDGNTIDEMKLHYERERDRAFASHSCPEHAKRKILKER
ncbi:MAG TPA: hypothetical protein VJW94_02805 [Candidatus Acidoferrum sp.]|nr:hypothetical protein [Candidatus Acidoferrum sp.]